MILDFQILYAIQFSNLILEYQSQLTEQMRANFFLQKNSPSLVWL